MRFLRLGIAALLAGSAMVACSSGDTGSSGGWRVSGAHIRIVGIAKSCPTPAPVLDTFESTPTPNPECSPTPSAQGQPSANPSPSTAANVHWQRPHTEDYSSATSQAWKPIYTTYTAPPGTGIYQPMVHATNQPMPTPLNTPTPTALPTPTPLATVTPGATNPPSYAQPSATPY